MEQRVEYVEKADLIHTLTTYKSEGYETLMDLSGIDYLIPEPHTIIFYLLHHPENYSRIRIKIAANRKEKIPSVTHLWKGADWYERELYDLFGIHFEGHPDLTRILMPDDWKGHPLLKDYPLTERPVQFKHNVKPKIPSEIIPHEKSKQ